MGNIPSVRLVLRLRSTCCMKSENRDFDEADAGATNQEKEEQISCNNTMTCD